MCCSGVHFTVVAFDNMMFLYSAGSLSILRWFFVTLTVTWLLQAAQRLAHTGYCQPAFSPGHSPDAFGSLSFKQAAASLCRPPDHRRQFFFSANDIAQCLANKIDGVSTLACYRGDLFAPDSDVSHVNHRFDGHTPVQKEHLYHSGH